MKPYPKLKQIVPQTCEQKLRNTCYSFVGRINDTDICFDTTSKSLITKNVGMPYAELVFAKTR